MSDRTVEQERMTLASELLEDGQSVTEIKHESYDLHRLNDEPQKRVFSEAWQKYNEQSRVLAYLLAEEVNVEDWDLVSIRDIRVAATVIQWLCSRASV